MLMKRTMPILDDDTSTELGRKLSELGAAMIVDALGELGDLTESPQLADGVRYARKIEKSETRVDWSKPAVEVDRKIRGLSAVLLGLGARSKANESSCSAARSSRPEGAPGQVLDDRFTIACGCRRGPSDRSSARGQIKTCIGCILARQSDCPGQF